MFYFMQYWDKSLFAYSVGANLVSGLRKHVQFLNLYPVLDSTEFKGLNGKVFK